MNFIGIDTTVEFFIEFYWYRYRNGIFYMNFIGIDTTVEFLLNFIGIGTAMVSFT